MALLQSERKRTTRIQLWLALVAAAAMVVLARRVDWTSANEHIRQLGVRAPLAFAPYFFVLLVDTMGWQRTFDRVPRLRLDVLWRIRVATEAVIASLPAGVAIGEPLRVLLLERFLGVPGATATANVVATKLAMAFAQGGFIACGVAIAASSLDAVSSARAGGLGTVLWALAGASLLLATMGGSLLLLIHGRLFSRALLAMRSIGHASWRALLARLTDPFDRLDRGFAQLRRVPLAQVGLALALFFLGWLGLGIEDWLILALLGAHVSLATSISMEGVVSLVRIGFFFLPGALGAQEVSYYGLLKVAGTPDAEAIAAAFVVVKRAKELFWIALGYLLLLSSPARLGETAMRSEVS
jgi:hypothetical protein